MKIRIEAEKRDKDQKSLYSLKNYMYIQALKTGFFHLDFWLQFQYFFCFVLAETNFTAKQGGENFCSLNVVSKRLKTFFIESVCFLKVVFSTLFWALFWHLLEE